MPYVSTAELRAEGVPASITDPQIAAALATWEQFIDRATRQFFESRAATLDVDGNDSHILFLSVPVITVTALYVNGNFTTALDTANYSVYNGRSMPDDRKNPKIQLGSQSQSIFDIPRTNLGFPAFLKGARNQRIVGTFGYTEADGSTPLLIKRAVKKLAIRQLKDGSTGMWSELDATTGGGANVMSETTDGHTITYDAFRVNPSKPGLHGITGDQEVDRIIDLYRAPLAMAVPGSITFFKG